MDYSFYGGRPGQSMVIVKYFTSIEKMNTAFNQGDSYTEVGYGECVLIDTEDPRNLENGQLYKRGLQGAEYLGTIKGPAGYPPHMVLNDYETIQDEIKGYKDKNGIPLPGMDYLDKEGEFDFIAEGKNNDLVPGYVPSELNKDGTIKTEAQYQDTIKWIYASVRDFNEEKNEEETTVKIGFKIPYHVYEQAAYSISAYTDYFRDPDPDDAGCWDLYKDENGEIKRNHITYSNLADRVDDKTHPFYSKWRFAVPQGVKGDSIKGLKVLTVEEYKNQRGKDIDNNGDIIDHFEWEEEISFTDADNDRQILVYEYYDYRNKFEGDRITKYLGAYNTIKKISVDEFGTMTVYYTYDEKQVLPYVVKNITNISLDQNGVVTFYYNIPAGDTDDERKQNENPFKPLTIQQSNNLKWIERTELTDNYHLKIYDNQGESTDLGSIKVDSTLSVAFNIKPSDSITVSGLGTITAGLTIESNILYLNNKYPQGLTENASGQPINAAWMKGKIVTVGPVDPDKPGQRKNFYAFDYNENTWYYLGNLGGLEALRFQQVVEKDENNESINNAMAQLEIGGVCLIVSQRPSVETASLDFVLEE